MERGDWPNRMRRLISWREETGLMERNDRPNGGRRLVKWREESGLIQGGTRSSTPSF